MASVVTTFLLLGRYLEANAKAKAGDALRALLDLGAKDATILQDGTEVKIPASRLAVGDLIVVRPGEKIATDGVVVDGASAVDASLVTGESVPVDVGPGSLSPAPPSTRPAGCWSGPLASARKPPWPRWGGSFPRRRPERRRSPGLLTASARYSCPWSWPSPSSRSPAGCSPPDRTSAGPELRAAFTAAVAVLVIACPCALGLATPVGLLTGTGRGAQLGILIKGPQVLEDTRTVDTILLDKTGTVTSGQLSVDRHRGIRPVQQAEVLRLAGAVDVGVGASDRRRDCRPAVPAGRPSHTGQRQ